MHESVGHDIEENSWSTHTSQTDTNSNLFGDMAVMWNKGKSTDNNTHSVHYMPTPPPRNDKLYIGRAGVAWLPVAIVEIIMLGCCIAAWQKDDWTAVICILILICAIASCAIIQYYFSSQPDVRHKTPLFTINEISDEDT